MYLFDQIATPTGSERRKRITSEKERTDELWSGSHDVQYAGNPPNVGDHTPDQIFRHLSNMLGIPEYWTDDQYHPAGGYLSPNVGEVTVKPTWRGAHGTGQNNIARTKS